MGKSRVSKADMQALSDALPQLQLGTDLTARLQDWLALGIATREAQETRSKTAAHAELMHAYYAAVHQWEQAREQACVGYAAEEAEFERDHPRPTFQQYLLGNRQPAPAPDGRCRTCGVSLSEDDLLDIPEVAA